MPKKKHSPESIEKRRAYCREYYWKNRERRLAYCRGLYYKKMSDPVLVVAKNAKAREQYERRKLNNPQSYEKELKRDRVRSARRNRLLRQEMLREYGGVCVCCGETAKEFLTLDHINGNGAEERRAVNRRGTYFYRVLKKRDWPKDNYRLLCMNCNFALGRYGYCPHTQEVLKVAE